MHNAGHWHRRQTPPCDYLPRHHERLVASFAFLIFALPPAPPMADTEQAEAPAEPQSRHVVYCGGTS